MTGEVREGDIMENRTTACFSTKCAKNVEHTHVSMHNVHNLNNKI